MEYLRQIIDSDKLHNVFDLPLTMRNKSVEVIILPVGGEMGQSLVRKRRIGFVKCVPPLPDSFFEPLPEDELRVWE